MSDGQREWYTVYKKIKKTVVMIQVKGTVYTPDEKGKLVPRSYIVQQGSGFIYEDRNKRLGLITAYHIVRHGEGEYIVVWALTKQNKWVSISNCQIAPFSNEKKDIAVLSFDPPGKSIEDFETVGFPKHAFQRKILMTGVDIVWCGYPPTIRPFIPIFQKGMIAGYDRSQYIVDGMVNPGSSGGPIFYDYNIEVVGMISAHALEPSRYRLAILEGEQNRLTQVFGSPSGLGIAIPAMNILEIFGIK